MLRLATFFLTLAFTLPAIGQVYSWQDESGRTHYSDSPPLGVKTNKLIGGASVPLSETPEAKPQKSTAELEMEFRQRRQAAVDARAEKEKKDAEQEQLNEACASARDYLTALQSGQRIQHMDSKTGAQHFLDDSAREKEITRVKKQVQAACKKNTNGN